MDDYSYIKQVQQGNTQAFEVLVDKYKDMVYTIALKTCKNPANAEEIAQESFIKAFKACSTFKGEARFSTWLYRITYNTAISSLRKQKTDSNFTYELDKHDKIATHYYTEQEDSANHNREKIIQQAVQTLSDEEQLLIRLYYNESISVAEIAKIMQHSESNVKVKLFRARKKLEEYLSPMVKAELIEL